MPPENSTSGSSTTTLVTAAVGGVLIGAAAVAALFGFGLIGAGDEPPIWVKRGSVTIELVSSSKKWKEDGSRSKWKISSGTRGQERYQVVISTSTSASCPGGNTPAGRIVVFEYSDQARIRFNAAGRHTRVDVAPGTLSPSVDGRILTYGSAGSGHIAKIEVDQNTVCTFSQPDPNLGVVLLDK